ncbi:3-oxoacyl-[acyl-carrier protein] reductase [Motilibacter peucedani]|uniref:3-oxoacyl-[acyl-carrier protein] reductase n=1 Tax=Motilibacter peucedani TaxID=598650 RepID=A0A420XTP5_9ACTN|nr:SDR family oxidoreductase [Motilibacter peucedani]RKS80213.1 3-oxoacyl-[acyl-carrier protein] reductase [Motilibacter peucedani]
MSNDLSGRVAVVTGGGSGLGRATSTLLAESGAHVLVADVNAENARTTVEQITSAGGSAEAVDLDVTSSEAVDAFFQNAFAQHGESLDVLVNNAGTDRGADIPELSDEQWHGVFAVNVHGPFYTARAFVRGVLAAAPTRTRPADIVSIVSISALTVGAGAGAYNASKAAHLKLTEVLQTESRERGWPVRVCAVNPAAMNTPMMDQWNLPQERMMDPRDVAGMVHAAVSLPAGVVLQTVVITNRTETYPR